MIRFDAVATAVLTALVSAAPAPASARDYLGFCEASAAARIGDRHFAAASDDSPRIRIYERGKPAPVGEFDAGEVKDMEAAARIGDVVYWSTSNSRNKHDEEDPGRQFLFATAIGPDGKLSAVGTPYRGLRADLLALLPARTGPAKRLEIEGMAPSPAGGLFIGLRGPRGTAGPGRDDKLAYVIELSNPGSVLGLDGAAPAPARTRLAFSLDLSGGGPGRGIRDMARIGDRYLILAGSEPDLDGPAPLLFWWDGKKAEGVTPGPAADFAGMVPEAIVVWDDHTVEILSDDGERRFGGKKCKDQEGKPAEAAFKVVEVTF